MVQYVSNFTDAISRIEHSFIVPKESYCMQFTSRSLKIRLGGKVLQIEQK